MIAEAHEAWRSFAQAGFLSAHWDEEEGGLQMPEVNLRAAMSLFFCANVSTAGYPLLSIGAANLLRSFGSEDLKRRYLAPMWTGQRSALGDIRTYAVPQSDGTYRIFGQKISLFEDQQLHPDLKKRLSAQLLLDVLTPVVKSWPARYGCASNDMAMQMLGGAGYTREYPLEQLYRDQRLNPIHEGTEAIQALDLLGRKVVMQGGAAFALLRSTISSDARLADEYEPLRSLGVSLQQALGFL